MPIAEIKRMETVSETGAMERAARAAVAEAIAEAVVETVAKVVSVETEGLVEAVVFSMLASPSAVLEISEKANSAAESPTTNRLAKIAEIRQTRNAE